MHRGQTEKEASGRRHDYQDGVQDARADRQAKCASASYQRGYRAELARIGARAQVIERQQAAQRAPRGRLSALAN